MLLGRVEEFKEFLLHPGMGKAGVVVILNRLDMLTELSFDLEFAVKEILKEGKPARSKPANVNNIIRTPSSLGEAVMYIQSLFRDASRQAGYDDLDVHISSANNMGDNESIFDRSCQGFMEDLMHSAGGSGY